MFFNVLAHRFYSFAPKVGQEEMALENRQSFSLS